MRDTVVRLSRANGLHDVMILFKNRRKYINMTVYLRLIGTKGKNMNKSIKAVILFLLICSLTGCFPTGELNMPSESVINSENTGNSNKDENISYSAPRVIEAFLKIDVPLPDNYPTELPVLKATVREFDAEAVKAVFIDGKTIDKDDSQNGKTMLFTDDGTSLYVDKGNITFITDAHLFDGENEKRSKSMMQQTAAEHAASKYLDFIHTGDELDGFPRSEARERADELVKMLDIKYLGEPQIYAVTAEDSHNFDENIVLTKNEECYLVKYLTTYNGIPIPNEDTEVFVGTNNESSWVNVILTKDKLVKFSCFNILESIEETGTAQIKCSAETALSKLYDYYDMQIDEKRKKEKRYEYDKMSFAYVSSNVDRKKGEYIYSPLVCVSGGLLWGDPEDGVTINRFIDPVTGTVLNSNY